MSLQSMLRKLNTLVELSTADTDTLLSLPYTVTDVRHHRDILAVGERPDFVYVILSGWAARYSRRADGSRRITGLMLPGDFCGIHAVAGAAMEHAIVAVTNCEVGKIDKQAMEAAVQRSPAIGQALWRAKLIDEAILRVWLMNSQDAYQAMAHLLCELFERARMAGLAEHNRFYVPLTQEALGELLGITAVHTNRVMRRLQDEELVDYAGKEFFIPDVAALKAVSSFSPAYLHQFTKSVAPA